MDIKGELSITWLHHGACPARLISVMSAEWPTRRKVCLCGMPTEFELECLDETASLSWVQRVESGEADD